MLGWHCPLHVPWIPVAFSMQWEVCQGIPKPAPVSAPFWKHKGQRKGGRSEGCPGRAFLFCVPCSPGRSLEICVTYVTLLALAGPRCCFPGVFAKGVLECVFAFRWFLDPPVRNRLWWPWGCSWPLSGEGARNVVGLGPAPCPHKVLLWAPALFQPLCDLARTVTAHPLWMSLLSVPAML